MNTQTFLRRDKAAEYLQANWGFGAVDTLATLATRGGGPRFRKLGRFPVYTEADLDDWARSRLSDPVSSTSELPAKRTA